MGHPRFVPSDATTGLRTTLAIGCRGGAAIRGWHIQVTAMR